MRPHWVRWGSYFGLRRYRKWPRSKCKKSEAKFLESPIFDLQKCNIPQKKPHGRIILAKGQLDHSYTFWTMANYTTVDCLCFFDSDVSCLTTTEINDWLIIYAKYVQKKLFLIIKMRSNICQFFKTFQSIF